MRWLGTLAVGVAVLGCGRVDFSVRPRDCAEIRRNEPGSASGIYAIGNDATEVYCDMETLGGGWTRVAEVLPSDGCPGEWRRLEIGAVVVCTRPEALGSSRALALFPARQGEPYTEVMGWIRGLEYGSMDAFSEAGHGGPRGGLSSNYVDGISIMVFEERPVHVWTYVAAWSDTDNSELSLCPCLGGTPAPAFVGEHFFCEGGHSGAPGGDWAFADPLWDGDGTGTDCDTPADPSRFQRAFDEPLTGPFVVVLMADQESSNEDVGVLAMELYVR